MQFKKRSKESKQSELKETLQTWHTWYAWYPVRVNDDTVVWLSNVRRRLKFIGMISGTYYWEYSPCLVR